jgi:type IV pilus assembly protein PilX
MKACNLDLKPLTAKMIQSSHKQQGVVLFVALIVLVAMSLAGVSLLRTVDTGTQVAGNLASHQSAANAPDEKFEIALGQIVTMVNNGSSRNGGAVGYSIVAMSAPVENRDWTTAQDMGVDPYTGNRVQILIDRLCSAGGGSRACELTLGDPANAIGRGIGLVQPLPRYQHFRTIARITDPKGMVSYVEFKND